MMKVINSLAEIGNHIRDFWRGLKKMELKTQ